MSEARLFFDLNDERGLLRLSIVVTLFLSAIGVVFGLASGSYSIIFDGIYSLVDASMSALSLLVVQLITSYNTSQNLSHKLRERFSMGFWHLEPMVLALNGILLTSVAIYALINAISSVLEGGRHLEFGLAVVYSLIVLVACVTILVVEGRANRRINSEFVRMDMKGWVMSSGITAALLIAFCVGYAVQGTTLQWISPYIDPTVLALVCLAIIPLPMPTIRLALREIFLITPQSLKQHVDSVAHAFVKLHKLRSHRAYVAKSGRSREIEVYFIVPTDMPPQTMEKWDTLRTEFSKAIGGDDPNCWLTVIFTADPLWAE